MSAIHDYLDALRRELPLHPLYRRRVLAEVEDHLRESAAEHGEQEALARFGAPRDVAARFCGGRGSVGGELGLTGRAPLPARLRRRRNGDREPASAGAATVLGLAGLLRPRRDLLLSASVVLAAACLLAFGNLVERARLYGELEAAGRIDPLAVVGGALYLGLLASAALGVVVWASLVAATARRASSS